MPAVQRWQSPLPRRTRHFFPSVAETIWQVTNPRVWASWTLLLWPTPLPRNQTSHRKRQVTNWPSKSDWNVKRSAISNVNSMKLTWVLLLSEDRREVQPDECHSERSDGPNTGKASRHRTPEETYNGRTRRNQIKTRSDALFRARNSCRNYFVTECLPFGGVSMCQRQGRQDAGVYHLGSGNEHPPTGKGSK